MEMDYETKNQENVENISEYDEVVLDVKTQEMLRELFMTIRDLETRCNLIARVYLNSKAVDAENFSFASDLSKILISKNKERV